MGSTKIEQPQTPAAPSTAEGVKAWADTLPQVYETQMAYAPKEAQQQLELLQQYGLPLGETAKAINEGLYPETAKLQENLAKQASEGIQGEVPDWMRKEYLSNLNASLGTNIGSPIAADYTSRGLLQQKQDWQNYYRDLGLSVSGRQPLAQGGQPNYSNYMSNYSPNAVMGNQQQGYSAYANLYGNMYNTNAQMAQAGNPYFNALAGMGGTALGGWLGRG